MSQSSSSPTPVEHLLREALEDSSISSRALAFVYCLSLAASGETLKADQREIEAVTGMQRERWPEAEARALGVYLVDRGSTAWTEGHGMAGTWRVCQFAATSAITKDLPQHATVQSRYRTVDDHTGGREVAHPASSVWDNLGRHRHDAWRLAMLLGLEDVPVSIKSLHWLPTRTGRRLLARLREERLVADGVWQGARLARLVEALGGDAMYRQKYARAKAASERAARRAALDGRAHLERMLERDQPLYLALALECGSLCATEWATDMADPEKRRAFAHGSSRGESIAGW